MSQPQPRKHLAKRWWGPNGLTIRCTCGQWRSTSGTRTEQDDAHRNHRAVMGEIPKDRKPSTADQLRARVRELEDRLDERTADVAERALENTRLRAEKDVPALLAQVRQLEAELATERAVAESNQRAALLLAADVQRLTAELAEAHAATETNREISRVLLAELATHREPAT